MSEDGIDPAFGAVFAVNMLVSSTGGGSYSEGEYRRWLTEAQFRDIESLAVPDAGNTRLLFASVAG
ncbi:MAG: hypothetical protein JXR77_18480 [Lentisphaeria bacterium]|nr:hypothetical protein [Lentisphaeria bacterium]